MKAMPHIPPAGSDAILVGTGGIGTGVFFALDGMETLGREESRSGRFLDQRDYCKLHIVAHGVKKLSGPKLLVYPVGRVGNDADGHRLMAEMQAAELLLDHVKVTADAPTLRAVSFLYPDGSGGNLTTRESASHTLQEKDIRAITPLLKSHHGRGFAVALPEVPLAARKELLSVAQRHDFFTAASFLSSEMAYVRASSLLNDVDLLAVNADEAACLAEVSRELPPEEMIPTLIHAMTEKHPHLRLCVTAGRHGSWTWELGTLRHVAPCAVEARNAAGAGDTHLAGLLAGLGAGLSFADAHQVAALAGAFSVTSEHAIHPDLSRANLLALSTGTNQSPSEAVREFLKQKENP